VKVAINKIDVVLDGKDLISSGCRRRHRTFG
jgi:hypothetical protein